MVHLALTSLALVLCVTLTFADYRYSGYGHNDKGQKPYSGYSVEYANSQSFYAPYSAPFPFYGGNTDCGLLGVNCGNGTNFVIFMTAILLILLLRVNSG